MYKGGCIFVDSASWYVHVKLQATLGSSETLQAKEAFELMCRDAGVIPTEYLLDNGSNFTSKAFAENLLKLDQKALFAGVGAHHHNGIAERHIQTIMAITRSMLIHSAVHWPAVADTQLWPMAVQHAVYIWNHMPSEKNGLSPIDVFTRTRWPKPSSGISMCGAVLSTFSITESLEARIFLDGSRIQNARCTWG
jgi:transposase InsO family protein